MDKFVFETNYVAPSQPYNIMSVCVFQMKKSYKKIDTYVYGLKYTADTLPKVLPNFYLRVYYDQSILNNPKWLKVIDHIKTNPKVQLVKFTHPWFVDEDGYHLGTFGTLVRLYPLFSNDESNLQTILIGDVDFNEDMFPYWRNTYKIFKNSLSQVHMYERKCNHHAERVQRIVKYLNLPFSPFLNSFWSKIRFPKELLDTFLMCLHDPSKINSCDVVNIFVNETDYSKVKKANQMERQKVMYGIDEICLLMMLKHVMTNKTLFSYHTFPDLLIPFREAYIENPTLVDTKEHIYLVKQIMKEHYNDKKTSAENYNFMYKTLNAYSSVFNPKAPKGDVKLIAYFTSNLMKLYSSILSNGYKEYKLRGDLLKCANKTNFTGMKLINFKYQS